MNGFGKVNYKEKAFTADFTGRSGTQANVNGSSVTDISFADASIARNDFTYIKFYDVNGETYAYCDNLYVKKVVNGALNSVNVNSDTPPLIETITYNGQQKTLIIGKRNSTLKAVVGGVNISTVGLPYGQSAAVAAGRLFIADNKRLYYSSEFDFTTFTVGVNAGGFIDVQDEDGDILYLAEIGGVLYIVCKHSVYRLTPYGEQHDFTLKKITSAYIDVREKSAVKCNDTVYFMSGGDLFAITDGKVKVVGKTLRFTTFTNGFGDTVCGLYLLPVTVGTAKFVYFYDSVNGTEGLKDAGDYIVTGKYAYKTSGGTTYRINKTVAEGGTGTVVSAETVGYDGEYDFGTCLKKAITGVEAHITGSATMTITGDGFKTVTLNAKCNSFTCFLHGRSFSVAFTNKSSDFALRKLKIKYITYGG